MHRQREPVRPRRARAPSDPSAPTARRSSPCCGHNEPDRRRRHLHAIAPSGTSRVPLVQQINYDTALNGRLSVYGLGGNDSFAVDDNSATTTLDGGAGNDTFQIGQIFGSKRDAETRRRAAAAGHVPVPDRDDPRLAEPAASTPRCREGRHAATTSSPSTPTRPSCGSRATTTTTSSSSAPSRSPPSATPTRTRTPGCGYSRHQPRRRPGSPATSRQQRHAVGATPAC